MHRSRSPRRPRRVAATLAVASVLVAAAGLGGACDRPADPAARPATRPATTRRADAPVPTRVTITTLATLPAGRLTQLAPLAAGVAFALQDSGASAAVERLPPREDASGGAAADAPALTPAAIVRALGVPGGAGQIVAIAARDDGKIAFAFVGDAPRPVTAPAAGGSAGSLRLAAIGTFDPAAGTVFIGVDQLALADVDPTFAEAQASRPTLLTAGDDAWVWRTQSDGTMRVLAIRRLSALAPRVTARDVSIGATGDAVERRAWEWTATDEPGRFLLTDTASRWIRRLGEAGQATHVARFEDAAVASISPATLDAAGRVIVLSRDREGTVRSLLVQDGAAFREIAAARFTLDGKPLAAPLRVERLVPVPGTLDTFVAYDATTGAVVRVGVE